MMADKAREILGVKEIERVRRMAEEKPKPSPSPNPTNESIWTELTKTTTKE